MSLFGKSIRFILILITTLFISMPIYAEKMVNIPILCYHNLNPTKPGSMNMTPAKFESQIKWLVDNGFTVIPLQEAVDYLQGQKVSLPPKPIVITADDGWQSAYTYLIPIIQKYKIPVTLFIYPETISTGKNAMTWNEVKEAQRTGLVDIQSHTYSHPNFKQEKKHLSSAAYEKFVNTELVKSKKILEEQLGKPITLLAWPFGIYDEYLEQAAKQAGYQMAFSIAALPANRNFKPMAQPRYMIIDKFSPKTFEGIAKRASG